MKKKIRQLIDKSDIKSLKEFLQEILLNDDVLWEKFQSLHNNYVIDPGKKSVDELYKEYYRLLDKIKLPDEDEVIDSAMMNDDFYCDDNEMMVENEWENILEEKTRVLFSELEKLIEKGKILEYFNHYIALKEVLWNKKEKDDFAKLPSDEAIEAFDSYFRKKLQETLEYFSDVKVTDEIQTKILETIKNRYKEPVFKEIPFHLLEEILFYIPFNKVIASDLLKILQEDRYQNSADYLQMELVDIVKDESLKLQICERFAGYNDQAARYLLNKYSKDKKEYHRVAAKITGTYQDELNEVMFPHLDPAIDAELYKEVAFYLFLATEKVDYYRKFRDVAQNLKLPEILAMLDDKDMVFLKFQILLEEQEFQKAFELLEISDDYMLNEITCLSLLKEALPLKCYDYITQKALKMLINFGQRYQYEKAANLLSLLTDYPDSELNKTGIIFIEQLCKKYKKRRAMLEVFRKKGIKC